MRQYPDSGGLLAAYLETRRPQTEAFDSLRKHPNYGAIIDAMLETVGIDAETALEILLINPNHASFSHLRGVILNAIDGTGRRGMDLAQRLLTSLPRKRLASAVQELLPGLLGELEPDLLRRFLTDLLLLGLSDNARALAAHLDSVGELDEHYQVVLQDPRLHPRWENSLDDIPRGPLEEG